MMPVSVDQCQHTSSLDWLPYVSYGNGWGNIHLHQSQYFKIDIISGPLQDKTAAAEGHLIVSGSRDQSVRLWDAFHGKVLSVKQLPKRSSRKDKYDSYGPKDRLWLSVCWPVASPGHVISSSQG